MSDPNMLPMIEDAQEIRVNEYRVLEKAECLLRSLDDPRAILRALTYLNDKVGSEAIERSRVVIHPVRQPVVTESGGFQLGSHRG